MRVVPDTSDLLPTLGGTSDPEESRRDPVVREDPP
jgi:hypothetical protein